MERSIELLEFFFHGLTKIQLFTTHTQLLSFHFCFDGLLHINEHVQNSVNINHWEFAA